METAISEEARLAAKRGAVVMDDLMPNWASKIDLGKFNIVYPWSCVLGQVYGSFGHGIDEVVARSNRDFDNWADGCRELGFVSVGESDPHGKGLNAAWREEIEARQ